jgi:alkanesulfonate monooxygenase SsuD/methylene tetrahydromethanopterin reductase-like flavin-dependent oxidoreductase (luciferase family)
MFVSNHQLPDADPVRFLEQQIESVARLREGGWDSLFVGQHFLLDGIRKPQPFPYLARMAAESGEMRLGVAIVLAALTNPVELAENVATMDIITGGRFVLGAALGYREVAFEAFGVEKGQRARRLETNLTVVRGLLDGEAVDLDEPWCRLDAARLVNLPVQRRVPVWLGANGDLGVARAARTADTWIINPQASLATVARQMEVFRAERERLGRPPEPTELPALKEVFCAETREEAFAIAGPHLEAKYRTYLEQGQLDQLPAGEEVGGSVERLAHQRFIIGSPDDCVEQMREWQDVVGVDHFVLRTEWETMSHEVAQRSVDLLTSEVLPRLRQGARHD